MIFVTVGTQLPFDRLLEAIDQWGHKNRDHEIIAQTGPSNFDSDIIDTRQFVDMAEFKTLVQKADVLVAHAGMGSILSAIEYAKPVIIMARIAALGEHRNDHQLATANEMAHLRNVQVVKNEKELSIALEQALAASNMGSLPTNISKGHQSLIDEISSFISDNHTKKVDSDGEVS